MTEKKYRVNKEVKFDYSEIEQYIDENYTDKPLRNDEIVNLLNEQDKELENSKKRLKRVYNYFMDYLEDEMSSDSFSKMWDFVITDEKWD